ncbi:MAG: GNAT family N-acetyltransferase, partial [Paludibacteraceae bacterium]|nr:GNAT family N-acetyltransferase [Paludibacteraceae bacterium]
MNVVRGTSVSLPAIRCQCRKPLPWCFPHRWRHPAGSGSADGPPHQSEAESLEIIRTVFNNDTTWTIVLKETGEAIGAMGYGSSCECKLPARPDEPTVGYWVGKPYWNKGIC